eukprot:COSAG06_NODE_745_length_12649_cov_128.650916_14_plen_65_part_00
MIRSISNVSNAFVTLGGALLLHCRYREVNGRTAEPAGSPTQIANCILFLASVRRLRNKLRNEFR